MAAASTKRTLATALAAAVTVLLGATPAGAQQANPQPTSCAGLAFTDAAGDATTTRDSLDIEAGFFRYVTNAAGENVLTANIKVIRLDEWPEAGAYSHTWRFVWTVGTKRQYVEARMTFGGVRFVYAGGGDGERATTGRFLQGWNGIVEIVVPVDELQLAGQRLTNPYAVSSVIYSDGLLNLYRVDVDSAPDLRTGGKPFDVVPCSQEATPTAPQPATGPGTAEQATALRARLTRGKKLVATGRLASISGKGTVRLTLKGKKLKAGTYTLELTGRTAAGQMASRRVKARIRP